MTAEMSETAPDGDPATLARRLLRRSGRAALATSMRGAPYVSLALFVADLDASPLLLLSDLAQHSRNIAFDPRISLLIDATGDYPDPLTGPRLTLIGRAEAITDPRLLGRFVAHHPASAIYAEFADFRLYRAVPERGHLVAGFGRIHWIDCHDLLFADDNGALAAAEPEILRHMNAHHADAIASYARNLLGRGSGDWQMSGIDPEGLDLRSGSDSARLDFPAPVLTPEDARKTLVQLAVEARK